MPDLCDCLISHEYIEYSVDRARHCRGERPEDSVVVA